MLKLNVSVLNVLFVIYAIHMALIAILGDVVFKFNPVTSLILLIICISKGAFNRNIIALICLFFFLIPIVSLVTDFKELKDILFLLQDLVTLTFVFCALFLLGDIGMDEKLQNRIYYFCIISISLYFIMVLNPNLYDSELGVERYHGLFGSTNVSSTTILLFLIYLWEYEKTLCKVNRCCFFPLVIIFLMVLFFSKSRSLLFFIPYLTFQLFFFGFSRSYFSKILLVLCACLVSCISLIFLDFDYIIEILRLKEDSSFTTRGEITGLILDKIKDNYFVFPSGHNSAVPYLSELLGEERYPIHNDFIKYVFEWGGLGVFFIFCIFAFFIRKRNNLNDFLILFFALSAILHNIFFLFYIWIPMIFIFTMKNSFSK